VTGIPAADFAAHDTPGSGAAPTAEPPISHTTGNGAAARRAVRLAVADRTWLTRMHTGQVAIAPTPTTPVPPAPMLATAAALPADSTAYCIEPKWDGIIH
jgi:hypothetical protein